MIRFLFLLFFSSISVAGQSDYSIRSIPSELLKNVNSVLVDEEVVIDLTKDDRKLFNTKTTIAVLNANGDSRAQPVAYYDNSKKIKHLEATVYDAAGNELDRFKQRDFNDVSATNGTLYSDFRAVYLDYTPTSYPYTIVFECETESDDTAFIEAWYPVGGYATSTVRSKFRVIYNPLNKPKYRQQQLEGYNISITETPNEIVCVAENIAGIKYEEHAPPFMTLAPKVSFALNTFYLKGTKGFGKDWNEFGRWMNSQLLTGVNELPPATIAEVKRLVQNETTNEGKARKIYQYLQDKVRYISVQIGIGGWKPMPASDVDKLSYGDCKALTNYTKALLEVVGVPSYYTVLYSGSEQEDIIKDFTSMQGNHAILGVPIGDDITWLECTSQDLPFGFIGSSNDDRDVLIITPEGGKIVQTTAYDVEENLQHTTAEVNLNNDGGLTANFNSVSEGLQYGWKYAIENKTAREQEKYYKNRWDYINGISFTIRGLENDRLAIKFTEKLDIEIPNYASKVGEELLVQLNVFNQSQYIPPRISDRKQQVHIDESYKDVDVYTINLPSEYTLDGLPEDKVVESDFGTYQITFRKENEDTIIYTRDIQINKGVYPAEAYKKYRSFRRSIAKLDKTKILLKPQAK